MKAIFSFKQYNMISPSVTEISATFEEIMKTCHSFHKRMTCRALSFALFYKAKDGKETLLGFFSDIPLWGMSKWKNFCRANYRAARGEEALQCYLSSVGEEIREAETLLGERLAEKEAQDNNYFEFEFTLSCAIMRMEERGVPSNLILDTINENQSSIIVTEDWFSVISPLGDDE